MMSGPAIAIEVTGIDVSEQIKFFRHIQDTRRILGPLLAVTAGERPVKEP